MIAIAPKIAATTPPGPLSDAKGFRADDIATPPFSAVLEQAQPLLGETEDAGVGEQGARSETNLKNLNEFNQNSASTSATKGAGTALPESSISSALESPGVKATNLKNVNVRAANSKAAISKTTFSKTADSREGNTPTGTVSAPNSAIHDRSISLALMASLLSPILPDDQEVEGVSTNGNFQGDAIASADDLLTASKGDLPASTASTPDIWKENSSADSTANAQLQNPQKSTSAIAQDKAQETVVEEKLTSVGTSDAVAAAGLDTAKAGAASPGLQRQAPNTSAAAPHGVTHGASGEANTLKAHASIKSEIEKNAAVPPVLPLAPPSIASIAKAESVTPQTQTASAPDSNSANPTAANSGNQGKSVDATGAKSDPRKDDSASSGNSSGNSQPTSQSTAVPSGPASDSAPAFSVAGVQPSSATADSKNASASTTHQPGSSLGGPPEQKSSSAAPAQAQGENASPYPTSLVHSAKLMERIGEAELRLGIRAGEFGSVDIRTSMVRNQFTAEISVERGELGRVMAAELPGLQNRLAEQRVPVANIILQNHTSAQSDSSERQKPRSGQPAYATNSVTAREENQIPAMIAREATMPESRLDIHI
jgi:flagellar hook-length control protein FliK